MEKEIWKDVFGYEGLYKVSPNGEVKSLDIYQTLCDGRKRLRKGRILKAFLDSDGYYVVNLSKYNIVTMKKNHRLVGEAFIPNPENKATINHKDGIKTNNNVTNLEWNTSLENTQHAKKLGLKKTISHAKIVLDLQSGIFYDSARHAADAKGYVHSSLKSCLNGSNPRNKTGLIYA